MANTSAHSASQQLLQVCLSDGAWPENLLRAALEEDHGRALLRIVVERLGDLFEPRLCEVYARLMAQSCEILLPDVRAQELLKRYERVRRPRVCAQEPHEIAVLSRVTLGADVAVTSAILEAMKRRFPKARLLFVGSRKNWEMFEADRRVELLEFDYPRNAGLRERLAMRPNLDGIDGIVVDPDSRLSQLGLLPVCSEDRYFFFESRGYGGDGTETLVQLTRRWVEQTFAVAHAKPYIAPAAQDSRAEIAVSLGVGDNQEKRIPGAFEESLLRLLIETGLRVVVDEGAGGEESERVRELARRLPKLETCRGSYASFASLISKARLYVGYDSAGQHVAAAAGVPLISIFAGFVSDRMYERWRPDGCGPACVIKVDEKDEAAILRRVQAELQNLTL